MAEGFAIVAAFVIGAVFGRLFNKGPLVTHMSTRGDSPATWNTTKHYHGKEAGDAE